MPFYVPVGPRGVLFLIGTMLTHSVGSWAYWRARRRRSALAGAAATRAAI